MLTFTALLSLRAYFSGLRLHHQLVFSINVHVPDGAMAPNKATKALIVSAQLNDSGLGGVQVLVHLLSAQTSFPFWECYGSSL